MVQQRQTHREEVANVISHGVGMVFGLIAITLLLMKGVESHDPWVIGSLLVYAFCMTSSYVTSTLYHASRNAFRKQRLRRFDHAAIYLHIAGTYTPFTLIALRQEGIWGWMLFAIVWIAAAFGVWISFRHLKRKSNLKTACYLLMGWVVLIAFKPLIEVFQRNDTMPILYWLIAGGVFYSVGTIFFFLDKYKYMHTGWHLFVLMGTICHFLAVYLLA